MRSQTGQQIVTIHVNVNVIKFVFMVGLVEVYRNILNLRFQPLPFSLYKTF